MGVFEFEAFSGGTRAVAQALTEVDGVSQQIAREALTLAAAKLPIKTRFIERIAG